MRKLESEKAAIQREVDSAKKPLGPATSSLVPKLRATSGKIDDINTLINLYENKWVYRICFTVFFKRKNISDLNCIKGCVACLRRKCQDTRVTCWNFPCHCLFSRATASMFLEKQRKNVDGIVSGFEDQLVKDGTILDQPKALQSRKQQLQVL